MNRKSKYYLCYTILFLILVPIVFSTFFLQNKSLIWNSDGMRQHYIALMYFGKWGREILKNIFIEHNFIIPLWDFHVGYGSDVITTFHYYTIGDPLNLFSWFVPEQYTEYLYQALIILRLYLSGISFSCYCFQMKKENSATLAGTLSYVFCGYMLFGCVRHPFFMNPMIYLPLLLTGAERIFYNKKPTLFIYMVFLSAVSNFYFFYMIVFAVCLYVGIRFFTFPHTHIGKEIATTILHFFKYACVGVCMSAFILLPVLLQFFSTNRTNTTQVSSLVYSVDHYGNLAISFLSANNIGEWSILGFTVPCLLAIFTMFSTKKKYAPLKVGFLILSIFLCIPFFGKVLNGFSYVSNRWCFIFAGLISYILTTVWEDMLHSKNMQKLFRWIASLAYMLLLLLFQTNTSEKITLSVILILANLILDGVKKFQTASVCLISLILFHICTNAFFLYGEQGHNYASNFSKADYAYEKMMHSPPKALQCSFMENAENDTFFRYETDDFTHVNASSVIGEYGVAYYWSLENSCIADFYTDMAIKTFHVFNYKDLDHRTFLDALAGVKYFISLKSNTIPYGYEYKTNVSLSKKNKYDIYENKYALPLGYTYESYIPYEKYKKMHFSERQEALMQGIVTAPKDQDLFLDRFPKINPILTEKSINYTLNCGENIVLQPDGSFMTTQDNTQITLSFQGLENCENYLSIEGAEIQADNPSYTRLFINAATNTSSNTMQYLTSNNKYYKGQKDYLINLGYQKEALSNIVVTLPRKGTYKFDRMEVICQPMTNYSGQIAKRKENILENEKIDTNSVSGTIRLAKDKILCLSIPYSRGWTAQVDAKKTKLLKANTMYMALPLTKGEHKIELHYRTPGLFGGILISLAGWIALFGILKFTKAS